MATTVNNAFSEFMTDSVNLDKDVVTNARNSRDNLLSNISEFGNSDGFFDLCQNFNVHFGSFSRKTKCRELDDIDLMIGISANGATYNSSDPWDNVHITPSITDSAQRACLNFDGTLNSTKVINKFKNKLVEVREYSRSDIHKSGEAVVLNLTSKVWSFDIVPCFHTVVESNGRSYYLIPNGKGNWKKTDPSKDRDHVTNSNQAKDGRLLELVRLTKKWNKVKKATTIPSYLLETMVVNYTDSVSELDAYIDLRFINVLKYISNYMLASIYDLKGIQGNINTLSPEDRLLLQSKAHTDYLKACTAQYYERNGMQKDAINKWREILGGDFPTYG